MVRMMDATIRVARKAGVHVIVVGTPIPYEDMRESVGYDPEVYATRFAVLRAAVKDAGGIFVDAHETLARDLFTDPVGHFDEAGATILAERIRPVIEQELARFRRETWLANHPVTPRAP